MKRSNTQPLKDVIENMLESYQLKGKIYEHQLVERWEKFVGKPIAKHTVDLKVRNGKLYVTLDSAVIRQELSYAKEQLIEQINTEFSHNLVRDIVFR